LTFEENMHRVNKLRGLKTAAIMFAAILIACGGDPLGPDGRAQVTRSTDNFLLQMWDLSDATETRSYTWQNTGTQATIEIFQVACSGSAILIVKDDAGTVVHQEDISNDNDTDTSVGVAGDWTIEVQLQNVNCSFSFRLFKKI
jgi:hypothetical protein